MMTAWNTNTTRRSECLCESVCSFNLSRLRFDLLLQSFRIFFNTFRWNRKKT